MTWSKRSRSPVARAGGGATVAAVDCLELAADRRTTDNGHADLVAYVDEAFATLHPRTV